MHNIIIFIFLGIVQGFTEPLPISSSGHMMIFEALLNIDMPGISFEAFVNFGSTIAIIIYFRKKIVDLFIAGIAYIYAFIGVLKNQSDKQEKSRYIKIFKKYANDWNYILKIIVATLPLVVVGLIVVILGLDDIENIKIIGIALIFTAIALYLVSKLTGSKSIKEVSFVDCLIIGLFQAVALMPGISRSGMSLVGALVVGMRNQEAFEFVFMLYLPASLGALLISLISIFKDTELLSLMGGYIIACIFAGIFTYLGLYLLRKLVVANKLVYFSVYCLIVGSLVTIFM